MHEVPTFYYSYIIPMQHLHPNFVQRYQAWRVSLKKQFEIWLIKCRHLAPKDIRPLVRKNIPYLPQKKKIIFPDFLCGFLEATWWIMAAAVQPTTTPSTRGSAVSWPRASPAASATESPPSGSRQCWRRLPASSLQRWAKKNSFYSQVGQAFIPKRRM